MATDIPFWLNANGPQQRMMSIWRCFQQSPFECVVYYVGPVKASLIDLARSRGLVVWPVESKESGRSGGTIRGNSGDGGRSPNAALADRTEPLTLADYQWPASQRQFRELLRKIGPHTVVLEYVTMSYLAETVRATVPKARILLDSHDVLHRRYAQFKAAGYRHWIRISEEEESAAAARSDVILAIQDDEAEWFRRAAPRARVMTVGHSFDFSRVRPTWDLTEITRPVVGYFGSNNGSNVNAINQFVETVWPTVLAQHPSAQLLIGGTIVDAPAVEACAGAANIRLQRSFSSPAAFYQEVHLVINPVRFGTGLKIKTVEALAHGRPVVTTSNGAMGIPESFDAICLSVDELDQMSERISQLLSDTSGLTRLGQKAHALARTEFADEHVFAELRQLLLGEAPRGTVRPI
jgi:glycosyltransferase involved in cell wall biosynthesis